MANPATDPLTFWTRALIRLGVVLALCALGPMTIDIFFFHGAAAVLAALALYMLAPLAVICLGVGGVLWFIGWSRRM